MSPLLRVGPMALRSIYFHQQRGMAAALGNIDPVQKLFVDKINEFKSTNRGLDDLYKKKEQEEITRLKKVYSVENEARLANIETNFPKTINVSLGDIDENKEKIMAIFSGDYQKQKQLQLAQAEAAKVSKSSTDAHHSPYHLPPLDREPYPQLAPLQGKAPLAAQASEPVALYECGEEALDPKMLEKTINVRFGPDMPTINDDKAPERDLVNYPRQPQLMDVPPRVFHVIPKSWIDFFHSKTGVSGAFTFATTFGLFLVSKEWIVMEHEICTGLSLTIIITLLVKKAGPTVSKYLDDMTNNTLKGWDDWQHKNTQLLDDVITHYTTQQDAVNKVPMIFNARKEDIQVQLEAEYRRRLKAVHDSTKKKLDYLVAVADSKRNISHQHMVNWVIDNAVKSIGPKQEADVLDNCIHALKNLASKNANII